MFQLTAEEAGESVRFQFGTIETGPYFRYLPYAHRTGCRDALVCSPESARAVQVNIAVMRAFVRLRETLMLHKELAHKLAELEDASKVTTRASNPLSEAIRQLMAPLTPLQKKPIGFHVREKSGAYRVRRKRGRA